MSTTRASTAVTSLSRQASDIGSEMSDQFAWIDRQVRAFVNQRPVQALLGAIAVGFLMGRVLRRRG